MRGWLRSLGARRVFLVGDSTGASAVLQTLMLNAAMGCSADASRRRLHTKVDGAVALSAWLDFTCSSRTYQVLSINSPPRSLHLLIASLSVLLAHARARRGATAAASARARVTRCTATLRWTPLNGRVEAIRVRVCASSS